LELERRLQEVDRDTEDRRRRVDQRERELMSGHLGSPTGLIRLREEVDHLKDGLRGAEDAELALLEDAERDDSELGSLERALEERTVDAARAAPELERRRADATARLEAVEAEARSTWEQLPADWQEVIERIHAQHADAVAEVRDGQCQGCHLAVTSSLLQTLRHGGLVTCDNCGRLLAG
ncbi:MAG: zinc ribbon domain-containing protein, partial [Candidatus Dormibacteraceae bacterium]